MILTGANPYSRSFYTQSGFSFGFQSDSMDEMVLRFTGTGAAASKVTGQFTFNQGKIYDPSSKFFGAYTSGGPLKFGFNFNTGKYSTWVNDDLLEAGRSFTGTNPWITGIYLSGARDIILDISLYGSRPGLYFSPLTTDDGLTFSGFVRVTGAATNLYSILPDNATGWLSTSNPFTSGNYYISGDNFASGSTINTDFLFDFGNHNEDLVVYQESDYTPTGYINIVSNQTETGQYLGADIQYQDFVLTSMYPYENGFQAYIKFLYRSGYTTVYGTGIGTGYYSGYISGSGYITGDAISGIVTSGYYNQLRSTVTTGFPGGLLMTGQGSILAYATGEVTYDYFIPAYAYEEYTTDGTPGGIFSYCTGYLQGTLTGNVLAGNTGKYIFTQQVTGYPTFYNNQYFTGGFNGGNGSLSFGYRDLDNLTSEYYWDGATRTIYTGQINHTGHAAGIYRFLGTGNFTGETPSGYIYSTATGLMTGFNFYTGESYIQTGSMQHVFDNYYNYKANGYMSAGYIQKPFLDSVSGGIYIVGARVTYDRNIPWGVTDYIELTARNGELGNYNTTTITPEGYSL